MTAQEVRALVAAILLLAGVALGLIAALGLLRMPDLPMRLHATSKAGTLGAGLMLAGVALHHNEFGVTSRVLVTVFFLILTGPVAAHIIGRAAFLTLRMRLWQGTRLNEFRDGREGQAAAPDRTSGR